MELSLNILRPYVPPRSAWAGGAAPAGAPPTVSSSQVLPTVQASPVELPTPTHQSPPQPLSQQHASSHTRYNSADNYYEDVDPRFVEPEAVPQATSPLPSALTAGRNPNDSLHVERRTSPSHLQPSSSYEDMPEGTRSPAASDHSNYTSISQRGINPAWKPPPGQGLGMGMGGVPNRRPVQPPDVLMGNPDFELPGGARGARDGFHGGRGDRIPGQIPGLLPAGGRYPGEI